MPYRVGVVGASGYSGAELLRLLAGHPEIDVAVATSREFAGKPVASVYPNLGGSLVYAALEQTALEELDLVFLALPHGASMEIGASLAQRGVRVVDFSADFRLRDAATYEQWYGTAHSAPEWLGKWVYGLPELHRDEIKGAALVANPGCYPTAAALALAPLVRAGLIDPSSIVISAASGVSGAGRGLSAGVHFSHVEANFKAYSPGVHKHTPEIEQTLGVPAITFVPHLVPMARGLVATCVASVAPGVTPPGKIAQTVASFYEGEPFVRVVAEPPETKYVSGSNAAHVFATVDERTGRAIAIAAIDNLGKGAAGQALQNANLMLGLPETTGLSSGGIYP